MKNRKDFYNEVKSSVPKANDNEIHRAYRLGWTVDETVTWFLFRDAQRKVA